MPTWRWPIEPWSLYFSSQLGKTKPPAPCCLSCAQVLESSTQCWISTVSSGQSRAEIIPIHGWGTKGLASNTWRANLSFFPKRIETRECLGGGWEEQSWFNFLFQPLPGTGRVWLLSNRNIKESCWVPHTDSQIHSPGRTTALITLPLYSFITC